MNNLETIKTIFQNFIDEYNLSDNNPEKIKTFTVGDAPQIGDSNYYPQIFLNLEYEQVETYNQSGFDLINHNLNFEVLGYDLNVIDNIKTNLITYLTRNANNTQYFIDDTISQTISLNTGLDPDIKSYIINLTLKFRKLSEYDSTTFPILETQSFVEPSFITSMTQSGNNLIVNMSTNNPPQYIFQLSGGGSSTPGATGPAGATGVGITNIVQTTETDFRIDLTDSTSYSLVMPTGATGSQGATGSSYNILNLINNFEYIDHLIPSGASSNQTQFFQAVVRSGAGSAGFLNQSGSWLGGTGIIRLSTGAATVTDLGIRATSGTSGHLINSNISEYYFGFYTIALQNSTNTGLFRLCIQKDNTATLLSGNRTGVYLDFNWETDGVKPTFSVFNNTVSSTILLDYALSINTLYAVKIRVSNSICELYINNVLLHTFTTNLPVFAPIQPSIGLTKTAGTTGITYLIDLIGAKNLVNLNNYNF